MTRLQNISIVLISLLAIYLLAPEEKVPADADSSVACMSLSRAGVVFVGKRLFAGPGRSAGISGVVRQLHPAACRLRLPPCLGRAA